MPRPRQTEAPPVNDDGPHVKIYDGDLPMENDAFYKFRNDDVPGDFLRLPCGKVVVKQCRAHTGGGRQHGRQLRCVHGKQLSQCKFCPALGQGGGSSYCICGVRRETCKKHKGTSCGISKKSMQRSSCAAVAGGKAATGRKSVKKDDSSDEDVNDGDSCDKGTNVGIAKPAMARKSKAPAATTVPAPALAEDEPYELSDDDANNPFAPPFDDLDDGELPPPPPYFDLTGDDDPPAPPAAGPSSAAAPQTEVGALKRKVDDLEERENKRLKSANTLRLSA